MRIRLDIAYDGTYFKGWASQPGLRTVQGVLETALARLLGGEPRLVVAGRTDAGVHATGQVAHLDLTDPQRGRLHSGRDGDAVARLAARLRGIMGSYSDVTVNRSSLAPEGFDARFSAVWRRYRYRISDNTSGYDPLRRYDTTRVKAALDEETMDAASRALIGLHDFATYCKPREGATTVRTLLDYFWARDSAGILIAEVRADAFCHSMVRALVGGAVAVGEGKLAPDDLKTLRDARARTSEFKVLNARGLTLTEVGYPEDSLLAARADQTRARRDSPANHSSVG